MPEFAKEPATPRGKVPPRKAPTAKEIVKRAGANGNGKTHGQGKIKEDFQAFKEKATDKARTAAEKGKDKATEAVTGIGQLIRDSAPTIDDNVGTQYGDYARSAADAVEKFAGKIESKDVDELVTDARDFVRSKPAVAIGAAAAIGFVLARMIRSGKDEG